MSAEPLLVPPREGAQAAPQVVVEDQIDQRPNTCSARNSASPPARAASPGRVWNEIEGVAVEDERGGRAGEVQFAELRRPAGKPVRQVHRPAGRRLRRHAAAPRAGRFRESAAGSSSWSASPVRCCSSLTAFSVWRMLSAAESTWLLRKSGSCRLTAISASAWILPSMRSQLDRDELGVLLRAGRSCRGAARPWRRCPGAIATIRSSPPAWAAARLFCKLGEFRRELVLVDALEEAVERGPREQQPQEQPQQPVETRASGSLPRCRRSPAAPRTPAAMPRISTQRACSRSNRSRASRGSPASIATSDAAAGAVTGRSRAAPAACTFASMAARNRGTEIRPAR